MKLIYRLAPCPAYETAKIQQWLEDMSADGLLLQQSGLANAWGVYSFRQAPPCDVRYRLEAVQTPSGLRNGFNSSPSLEILDLALELGWEFLGKCGAFYIYRSTDPKAPELHTEAETQAISLDFICRQQRTVLLYLAIEWLIVFPILCFTFFLNMITIGCFLIGSLFLSAIILLISNLRTFLHYHRMQQQLRKYGHISGDTNWRRGFSLYKAKQITTLILFFTLLVSFPFYIMRRLGNETVDLDDFSGDTPFVTLLEIPAEGVSIYESFHGEVRQWWEPISPVNYDWFQSLELHGYGKDYYCMLDLQYHDTLAPWIARAVAEDYLRQASISGQLTADGSNFEILDSPMLDAHYVVFYRNSVGYRCAIIQNGSTIVHATLLTDAPESILSLESWAIAMIADLKGGE